VGATANGASSCAQGHLRSPVYQEGLTSRQLSPCRVGRRERCRSARRRCDPSSLRSSPRSSPHRDLGVIRLSLHRLSILLWVASSSPFCCLDRSLCSVVVLLGSPRIADVVVDGDHSRRLLHWEFANRCCGSGCRCAANWQCAVSCRCVANSSILGGHHA
jgi:hypothetical protein